jgi:hypothetical protein
MDIPVHRVIFAIVAFALLFPAFMFLLYCLGDEVPSMPTVILLTLIGVAVAFGIMFIMLLLPEYRVWSWWKWIGMLCVLLGLARLIASFFASK